MRIQMMALIAGAAIAVASPAAAAVKYDFTALSSFDFGGSAGSVSGSFTYIAPTYVVGNFTAPLADLASCAAVSSLGPTSCGAQSFYASPAFGQANTVAIAFGTTNSTPLYYFANGAFSAPGIYDTVLFGTNQQGVLVVSVTGAVPEPASWAMLVAGFGMLGFTMRRRTALLRI